MLRVLLLVTASLFLTAAIIGGVIDPATWPSVVAAGVLFVGVAFERMRYGALRRRPVEPEWRETRERFIDDASGKPVTVWVEPATGQRRYVADTEQEGDIAFENDVQ